MSLDSPTIQQSLCLVNCGGALKNCGVSALRSRGYLCGALQRCPQCLKWAKFISTVYRLSNHLVVPTERSETRFTRWGTCGALQKLTATDSRVSRYCL